MIAAQGVVLPHPERLRVLVLECFAKWGIAAPQREVQVHWSRRLSTGAGRADLARKQILLNQRLLARVPQEIEAVLIHEAAHLAAHFLHGGKIAPHGAEWQTLMRLAGQPPRACHALPVADLRRRSYWYLHLCDGCGSRAIRRRSERMECSRCGPQGRILRVRSPRTREGYETLRRMSVAEVEAVGRRPGRA